MMGEEGKKRDRIGQLLVQRLEEEFLFDELSGDYLNRAGMSDILSGVPVPIRNAELSKGLSTLAIAKNMAYVIGCDGSFRYRQNYIDYILRQFGMDFVKGLIGQGADLASQDDYETAAIYFRAAIQIDPNNRDALYCYGRACRDAYERGQGDDYVARFKSESLNVFERLTMAAPDFDMGYYFLGFGYINLGLYTKAKLTWEQFMELSSQGELRAEIRDLLEKLEEPCRIEQGYNSVLAGRYQEGLAVLSAYEDDERFNTWWPLWYYLGIAYKGLEDANSAEQCFIHALKLAPSNIDTMEELVSIYQAFGDEVKREKYEKKIDIVRRNMVLDQEEAERSGGISEG